MTQQCYECGRESPLTGTLLHFHGCEYYQPPVTHESRYEEIWSTIVKRAAETAELIQRAHPDWRAKIEQLAGSPDRSPLLLSGCDRVLRKHLFHATH